MHKPLYKRLFFSALLSIYSIGGNAVPLVLTGEVASTNNQTVTAPKGSSWQIQIQWLAEEGAIVNEGDLIAVFDAGGIQTQLEENQEKLATQKLELVKAQMDLNQAVVEAEGAVKLADIMAKKTRIEANIPDGEISDYEKGKFVIAYEKALMDKLKAEEELKLKQTERDVGIQKQKIEITKLEENISYQEGQIEKLSVRAKISGPVSHVMHPWLPQKISAGTNVQISWEVLRVQAEGSYQVTSWVHEIDAPKLDKNNSTLKLTLDAYPNSRYTGKIISVGSQAEQRAQWSDSAYYRLDIAFDQPLKNEIFPGMSVRIEQQ